jgi:membrane dipeptidase
MQGAADIRVTFPKAQDNLQMPGEACPAEPVSRGGDVLPPAKRYTGYRSYEYLEEGRDYEAFELVPEFGRVPPYDLGLNEEQTRRTEQLLNDSIVISLHEHPTVCPVDVGELTLLARSGRERTGFAGLAQSGMTCVFDNFMDGTCVITSNGGWKWTDVIHDIGMRLCDIAHQDHVKVATRVADIHAAKSDGRIALVAALEASTMIENELDRIEVLYGFGVRQMGIAYSEANCLGAGLKERRDGGLTAFGRAAVERMNKVGMSIDVSHSGDVTSMDTIELSTKPIFITHAGARGVWDSNRMKPDDVIRACAERGGVIGLEAAPHTTLSKEHPDHSIESVMDHFKYIVDLVGIDHLAFGPDTFWGDHVGLHHVFASYMSINEAQGEKEFEEVEYVAGLENPTEVFWNITGWLVKNGYSDSEIQKVLGGNILRVLDEVWV